MPRGAFETLLDTLRGVYSIFIPPPSPFHFMRQMVFCLLSNLVKTSIYLSLVNDSSTFWMSVISFKSILSHLSLTTSRSLQVFWKNTALSNVFKLLSEIKQVFNGYVTSNRQMVFCLLSNLVKTWICLSLVNDSSPPYEWVS